MSAADTKGDGGAGRYTEELVAALDTFVGAAIHRVEFALIGDSAVAVVKPSHPANWTAERAKADAKEVIATVLTTAPPSPECSEGVEDDELADWIEHRLLACKTMAWDEWEPQLRRIMARLRTPPEGAREEVFHDGYRDGYNDALRGDPPSPGAAWCSPEPVGAAPAGVDALREAASALAVAAIREVVVHDHGREGSVFECQACSGYAYGGYEIEHDADCPVPLVVRALTNAGTPEGGEADG